MNVIIRNERKDELKVVENTIRDAFWNVYKPGCDEHLMAHQLHDSKNFIKDLDFVAEVEGQIVGNIICSKAMVREGTKEYEIVAVGPIGVIPEYRNKGIGSLLMKKAIDCAGEMGYTGMVLYGDPKYYHRFGFVNAYTYGITTPNGDDFEHFMVLELGKGLLDGISGKCYEDKAFDINADELIEFEKGFHKKEKDMKNIGEINFDKVVLDCKNPVTLSDFYVNLLGWHKGYETDDFIIIYSEKCNVNIGFQRNEIYVAPVWPEEVNKQQQMMHLDFSMEKAKLQEWINYALELGARKADIQYGDWAVMLDPEGHPFQVRYKKRLTGMQRN